MPSLFQLVHGGGAKSYAELRAEARRGARIGVTKPTVAARKAARRRRARSR